MVRFDLPLITDLSPQPPPAGSAEIRATLERTVTGEVRFDRLSRALYSTDASVYQIVPLGVVIPQSEDDILATLRVCERFRVPLTARGGGTSQAGQAIGAGIQLDCSKYLNRILEINADERWVRVQPGCVLDELNLAVRPHGLQFAPDISTSNRATIGGMVANNSSGTRSVLYGKTGDHVLEIKAVLADGSLIHARPLQPAELEAKCGQSNREGDCYRLLRRLAREHAAEIDRRCPRIVRRVGGYNLEPFARFETAPQEAFNLADLLIGSEGSLAVTLEAKLRLVPLPRAKAVLVVQFHDLLEALAATPAILRHQPSAVEVIDKYVLDSTHRNPEASRLRTFLHGDPQAILIIEMCGDDASELPARLTAVESQLREAGVGEHFHRALDAPSQARIWKLRKAALGLSMAEKGDAKAISFVEDAAVAPERLRDYIAELLALLARHGTTAGVYAHASVGCLHVRPVINLKTEDGVRRFEAIAAETADLVLKYGGALSGEHGDGLVRSPFQEKMYGPIIYQAFREIKAAFDPLKLLNPGKIVDAPPLASTLRYGPAYVTPEIETVFDFSADGGITRAAELCAGVGECRKLREGTMCPSYQATREEQHSTRGRANALRLALTGQLGEVGLRDPALQAALDLCLECKACKSECPTNVDMARLKAEYLYQRHRKHGLPLRNRLFGHIGRVSRLLSWLEPRASRLARWGWVRAANERLLGIDRRRLPPVLAKQSFEATFRRRFGHIPHADSVLLFPDTFMNYYEPELGTATVILLDLLQCNVVLRPPESDRRNLRCCGRPLISNGMLDEAVAYARHNVELLYPWAESGRPIIACEPSCILTIKDDYPALLRGDARRQAEVVARMCHTWEERVDALIADRGEQLPLRACPEPILVQAHCHQRSLTGMEPLLRLLRRIPNAQPRDLDAGCCGMAGSFGYEKEHYEISRLVGEQRLFPALRGAPPAARIVAPGLSCRLQIQHFVGRVAHHPALLLQALVDSPPKASK
jgi:FAD/FMN-containing dehydrogenase/Fe-S oxidoreductase